MPEPDEPPRTFAVHGFVSRPQVQKNNRNSIFVFVNGRLIRDRLLLHALSSAYHNLMPPACLPLRAAVSRLRLRRGGRECPSLEDGSALPASVVGARFRARCRAGAVDAVAARAVVSVRNHSPRRCCRIRNSRRCCRTTAGASCPTVRIHPASAAAARAAIRFRRRRIPLTRP